MFDEKQMQDIFERHFTRVLGGDAELLKREFAIGRGNRVDFVLKTKAHHLLVELQRGTLNREHAERLYGEYLPNYRKMRPDIETKGILVANDVTPLLKQWCTERNVDVITRSVREFLALQDATTGSRSHVPSGSVKSPDEFEGFTKQDFTALEEASEKQDINLRLGVEGKLYQIQEFLSPALQKYFGDSYLDSKVSNRQRPGRTPSMWLAFYFGAVAEGGTKTPHIQIVLEHGKGGHKDLDPLSPLVVTPHECSCIYANGNDFKGQTASPPEMAILINAELKQSFAKFMQELKYWKNIEPHINSLRDKGFEFRFYSKVPLRPQSANDNLWKIQRVWPVDETFHGMDIIKWFYGEFDKNNFKYINDEIILWEKIRNDKNLFSYFKSHFKMNPDDAANKRTLSAEGRSVLRLGKWWTFDSVLTRGKNIKNDLVDAVTALAPITEVLRG